jgi:photosystem II stability/assembly factor-like uncharacterized protein
MKNIINKAFLFMLIAFMATSFTGCLNLSGNTTTESPEKNNNQGVFKSVDGGRNWEQKVNIEGGGMIDSVKISSMKMDPQDNNIIYLGTTANGLYKSLNGAESWEKIIDENKILASNSTIYDIAVEKGNSNIIYIATLNNDYGELLKTEDGGKKWNKSHIIDKLGESVTAVEIDPISKNIIYAGTNQGGLLKSENKGETWVTLNWFTSGVKDILIDFQNNKGIVVRTATEIQKSTDRGSNWELLNEKITKSTSVKINFASISSITMSNDNPLNIYITYLNLIIASKDGGANWEKINTLTPSKTAIGAVPQVKKIGIQGNILYYGAGNVIYKSEDGGRSWSSYNIPIIGDVRYTISDYTNSDVIYAGSFYDPPPKKKKGLFGF